MNPRLLRLYAIPLMRQVAIVVFISIIGVMVGYLAAFPGQYRLLIALTAFACLFAVSLRKPVLVLFVLIALLPFTGVIRRLLIPIAGWTSYDPLLLVSPVLILILGMHWFVKKVIFNREPIAAVTDTRLFKLSVLFLLLSVIQIFNPLQGSLLVGAGGVLYYIVPLLWMVLSKQYINVRHMRILYFVVYLIGLVVAVYGLKQVLIGFAPFELEWVEVGGYEALMVGGRLRPFSTFPSSQEFASYLSLSIVIGWVQLLRGRWISRILIGLSLPVLVYAMFMVSARTPVILTILSLTIITLFMYRSVRARVLVVIIGIGVFALGYQALSSLTDSEDPLISHQVNGLINPWDEEHSTLSLHTNYFMEGIIKGFQVPIGHGLGSSTQAAKTLGSGGKNTEYDISDIMVSHGLIGGVLYAAMMIMIIRLFFSLPKHEPMHVALTGTLFATLGYWMIGELTSISSVLWTSIGYLDNVMKHHPWNELKRKNRLSGASETVRNG